MAFFDEFSFIKSIQPNKYFNRHLLKGIGDDAAVFTPDGYEQLVCMDTMIEGVHFTEKTMSPEDIGWKTLAANLSDIAAMGGIPDYFLVSVAIPPHWAGRINAIYKGLQQCANLYKVDLIGGDTVSSKAGLLISVTVLGHLEEGERAFYRADARAGDHIFVTGTLGDSAAGLHLLLENEESNQYQRLLSAHQKPVSQVLGGRLLRKVGDRFAVNDISDGLSSEANEIAEASGVGMEIWAERLPISEPFLVYTKGEKHLEWVLNGGEDYQLLFTCAPDTATRLPKLFSEKGIRLTEIGQVTEHAGQVMLVDHNKKKRLYPTGYNHFTNNEG